MKHGPLFCLALFFLLISLSNADTKPCVECMDQEVLKAVFAKNRFDKNDPDIIRGKYVRHGDKVLDNPAYAISGYMDIADAPLNACLKTNIGGIRFICFYDNDKKYITCLENTNPAPIPHNAAYARLSFNHINMDRLEVHVCAQPKLNMTFVNDICLPSTLWLLSDTQNDLFVQPFLKRWRPYDDFVRFNLSQNAPFMRRFSTVASIDRPVDGSVLTTELVNGDEFITRKRLKTTIRVGQKGVGDQTVTAQILGDSYVHGAFFRHALLDSGYVPNLQLVGLLKCGENQYNEGRGGWSLSSYFNIPTRPVQCYHGFMQPDGDFRYWGATQFWTIAWQCFLKTAPKGFEPYYSCSRFDDVLPRFDESTGYLKNPQKGDLQYDNDKQVFVLYDGEAWQPATEDFFTWNIDYSKYLSMWNIQKPDFLFVMLGLNDFRNNLEADFTEWRRRIGILKYSYLKANPDGKFVICIPCSTCGSLDNAAGDFTIRHNAAMWRFRKWLIDTFDKQEKDGYYLLDVGITIDNEHGYMLAKNATTVPFETYKGEESLRIQTGNPHPYLNYPSMGIPIAAFIQYYRNQK